VLGLLPPSENSIAVSDDDDDDDNNNNNHNHNFHAILTARPAGGSKYLRNAGFFLPNFKPPHPTDSRSLFTPVNNKHES
jgi:hypothetical protein